MNVCRCHLGSTISQHGDRESSRCLPACLSLRHLLGIAVQGRSLHTVDCHRAVDVWRIFSAADSCGLPADFRGGFPRRISAADCAADFSVELSISCGGFLRRIFGGFVRVQNHVYYKQSGFKHPPKIHHENPPHARLVSNTKINRKSSAKVKSSPH